MSTRTTRRLAAVSLIAGLGIAGSTMAASADPGDGNPHVDANHATSLTVHKVAGPTTGDPNNGTAQNVAGTPLGGVEFDAYQIQDANGNAINTATNDGLNAAAALVGASPTKAEIAAGQFTYNGVTYKLGPAKVIKTSNDDGSANFANMGDNPYLVVENVKATDVITEIGQGATVNGSAVAPAAPFVSILPMTSPDKTSWLYDVNAYPKNSVNSVTKSVQDRQTVTGETAGVTTDAAHRDVVYTVTGTVPQNANSAADLKTFVLQDNFDPRVTPTAVTLSYGGADLVAGTDYALYVSDAPYTGGAMPAGAKVEAVLTEAGQGKITTHADNAVQMNITARINAEGNGDIKNVAYEVPSAAWWANAVGNDTPYNPTTDDSNTPPNPVVSIPVDSLYGDLQITKQGNDNVKLAGAKFDVRVNTGSDPAVCTADSLGDTLVSGVTTDDNGAAVIKGLQASAWANSRDMTVGPAMFAKGHKGGGRSMAPRAVADSGVTGYCLVETQAPAGYGLNATPTAFQINYTAGANGTFTVAPTALTITDPKDNSLPLTGGAGAAGLGIGALVLIGVGGGVYAVKRRRDDEKDEQASLNA